MYSKTNSTEFERKQIIIIIIITYSFSSFHTSASFSL